MAMKLADRLLTIAITATLTSAAWIVAGSTLLESSGNESHSDKPPAAGDQMRQSGVNQGAGENGIAEPSADYAEKTPQFGDLPGTGLPAGGSSDASDARLLTVPVMNVKRADLIDTYTASRGGGARLHEAIDIIAPTGTSVVAAAPGIIEKLFVSDDGGNTIYIRSNDKRTIHYYAHLDQYSDGLKEGQRIQSGQRLGTVGSSGNATVDAPHLHFAVMRTTPEAKWWEPSSAVNPYALFVGQSTEQKRD